MNKVWKIIFLIVESAIVIAASGLAALLYFDGIYKITAFLVVVAIAAQITVCKRTRRKWIPVEECVPKEWNYVLISIGGGKYAPVVDVGYYLSSKNGEGYFFDACGEKVDVDAWMPLPKQYGGKCK